MAGRGGGDRAELFGMWARRWRGGGLVLPLATVLAFAAAACDSASSSDSGAGGGGGAAGSPGSAGGHVRGTGGSPAGAGAGGAMVDAGAGGGGGSGGAGGGVVDAGGSGAGGGTGAGGAVADAGAGAGGGGGPGCPLSASVPGAWSEIAAPAGLTSFAVQDSFALGPDDLIFAGVISGAPGAGSEARFLRWTGGCWSVELSVPAAGNDVSGPMPSVHGTGRDDLWAVAGQSIFHRTASGGWAPVDDGWRSHLGVAAIIPLSAPNLTRIRVAAADDVWIAESNNILHRTAAGWTGYNFDQPAPQVPPISFRFVDIWIDSPSDVWVAGGSDVQGNTMDPAFIHHFDGTAWTQLVVAMYNLYSVWRSGPTLWLATPGNLDTVNGTTVQRTLRAFSGASPAPTVPVAGSDPAAPVSVTRLWGRSAQDVWGAGDNLVHYDGTSWSVAADAPAPVRSNDFTGAFVGGDPAATWVVTSGARFFRQPVAPGVTRGPVDPGVTR